MPDQIFDSILEEESDRITSKRNEKIRARLEIYDDQPPESSQNGSRVEEMVPEDLILGERLPEKSLHMTRPTKLLYVYGIASILLGLAIIGCGIQSFVLMPKFQTRQSMQIESKWSNIILIFGGCSALLVVQKQTVVSLCATMVFALLSFAMGLSTAAINFANFHFRKLDVEYYKENDKKQASATESVAYLNIALAVLALVSSLVSILLYRHALHVTGKNFGFTIHIERHRFRLSVMGMTQLMDGILITALWVAIELLFQGQNADLHALPTSEVLAHGLVISAAGYLQMMATSKGNQPMLVSAALLNAASFILAAFFCAHPLSIMYYVVEHAESTQTDGLFDARFSVCAILMFVYLVQIFVSLYSLIKFIHLAAGERIGRIDNLMEKSRKLLCTLTFVQLAFGLLYVVLEVVAVSRFFMYKLDFSALPLFILASAIFAYGALRMGSALLITVTSTLTLFCGAFATRELYLFIFHLYRHEPTLEEGGNVRMTGANLVVHFCLAVLALLELLLSIVLQVSFLRTLLSSLALLYNRRQFPTSLNLLTVICILQCVLAFVIIATGVGLFLNQAAYLAIFGDLSISTGLLLFVSSVLQVLSVGKRWPSLLLAALPAQFQAFLLVWQQSDSFAYLLHNYMEHSKMEQVTEHKTILTFGWIVYALFMFYILLGAAALLMMGAIVEDAKFVKLETDRQKVSELVSMHASETAHTFVENGHTDEIVEIS